MKTALKFLLLLLFPPLSTFFIFLLSIKLSNYSTQSIKNNLLRANIYSSIIIQIDKQIMSFSSEDDSPSPETFIWPFIKQQLTPLYLQQKIEVLIDDIDLWASGKTSQPPAITFKEIKENIIAQNSQIINQFEALNIEFKKQQKEIVEIAKNDGGQDSQQMSNFDFEKIIKSDFSIPLGRYLNWIKILYWLNTKTMVLGLVGAIILLLIVLLSDGLKSKFRWLAAALFFGVIWNSFFLLGFTGILNLITKTIANNNSEIMIIISPLFNVLLTPFFKGYSSVGKLASITLFSSTLLCLIFSLHREKIKNKIKK